MKRRACERKQRGGSRVSLVITLLIVAAMIFAAIKVIPPYFANFELQDSMQTEARFALSSTPPKTADEVRNDVWQKAQDLSIPLDTKDEIQVIENSGAVNISIDYSVPVDLRVYQFTLQFHPHADNHTI